MKTWSKPELAKLSIKETTAFKNVYQCPNCEKYDYDYSGYLENTKCLYCNVGTMKLIDKIWIDHGELS